MMKMKVPGPGCKQILSFFFSLPLRFRRKERAQRGARKTKGRINQGFDFIRSSFLGIDWALWCRAQLLFIYLYITIALISQIVKCYRVGLKKVHQNFCKKCVSILIQLLTLIIYLNDLIVLIFQSFLIILDIQFFSVHRLTYQYINSTARCTKRHYKYFFMYKIIQQ